MKVTVVQSLKHLVQNLVRSFRTFEFDQWLFTLQLPETNSSGARISRRRVHVNCDVGYVPLISIADDAFGYVIHSFIS